MKQNVKSRIPMAKELPSNWQLMKFGQLVKIGEGLVQPTEAPYIDQLHVGPDNMRSGQEGIELAKTARELGLKSGKYSFDANAILYSKIRPNLNKVCCPEFEGICSADVYPLWPRVEVVDKRYLAQVMRHTLFVKQAVSVSARSGFPKINRPDLFRIRIPVPPLSEQLLIVEVLANWDRGIELIQRLLIFKAQLNRGLSHQLLVGEKRFSEFATSKRSEHKLGDIFVERTECNGEHLPLLSITANRGIVLRKELDKKDTSSEDKGRYKRILPGDIGYNTMRMWQGVSALSSIEGVVSPAYTVLIPGPEVSGEFAAHLFKSPKIINAFRRYSQGLVDDTLNLKFPLFARIRVTIPTLGEQRKIANCLKAFDQDIQLYRNLLLALQRQKRGLMQLLLTGRVRLVKGE